MSDRQRQQTLDEQDAEFLQELFDEAAEAEGEMLRKAHEAERKAGTSPKVPEALDAKCRERIQASQKKPKRIWFRKIIGDSFKNVAIVVLVLLIFTSPLVVKVDAIRVPVMNFFVVDKDRYSTLFLRRNERETKEVSIVESILSVRLPPTYELESTQELLDGAVCIRFKNENDERIQIIIRPSETMLDYDTEDAEIQSTTVYDWPAIYVEKSGHRIIWFNSAINYIFDVNATDINESEFWKYIYRLAK